MINFDLKKYLNPVFIETGLEYGDGVQAALDAGFDKIYSIEINPTSIVECGKRFSQEVSSGKLMIVPGDAAVEFEKVIATMSEPCTLWLDAHNYTDPITLKKTCSLKSELQSLKSHPIKTHTILIDDRRLFGVEGWGNDVTEDEVISLLKQINPDYSIEYLDGFIPKDVIAARITD